MQEGRGASTDSEAAMWAVRLPLTRSDGHCVLLHVGGTQLPPARSNDERPEGPKTEAVCDTESIRCGSAEEEEKLKLSFNRICSLSVFMGEQGVLSDES